MGDDLIRIEAGTWGSQIRIVAVQHGICKKTKQIKNK